MAVWDLPPVSGVAGGDVAGLVLDGEGLPAGAGPARLAEAVGARETEVDLFGYPGEQLRDEGLAGLAGKLSVLLGRRILFHADQFEEMLTSCQSGVPGPGATRC